MVKSQRKGALHDTVILSFVTHLVGMSSASGQKILLTCIVCVSVISQVNVIMGWWSPDNGVSTRIQIRQDEAGRAKAFKSYNEKEFSPQKGGSSQRDHLIGGHPTNVR